jgi:DNA (cytosine-5)-methyltransferase 1
MRHGSLFSGIGGFDLAAEWMGWENIFHCEWNPFGQRVLKHHFPKSISYEDITKTDFSIHRETIDILTGGFPCQPYSTAGKRLGKNDERHLFPEMLRAIREIKPRWVVGENVRGLVSWNGGLVFDEVQTDLEAEGYEVQPFLLPAASVNAPHKRDRVWFVAYSNDQRGSGEFRYVSEENGQISKWNEDAKLSDSSESNASNSDSRRLERSAQEGWNGIDVERESKFGNASNANGNGIQRQPAHARTGEEIRQRGKDFKKIGDEWDIGRWEIFPTKPPVCGGDDGLPRELDGITFPKWRNESIKAYGNAIVPQVALQIFKAIKQYEK